MIRRGLILCERHRKERRAFRPQKVDQVVEKKPELDKEKVKKMTSKEKRKNLLGYEHFEVVPPSEVDYSRYEKSYCRFCGSRYSEKFYDSKLGPGSLCSVHYKILRKEKLHLPDDA